MELKGKKINFLGDSITFGCGASDPATKGYVALMKDYNDLAEARNYGIGGTRIARQKEITNPEVDNDFNMRWDKMDPDADMIVVMNDGKITGVGTHEQLLAENIEYLEIYRSQTDRKEA